MTKTRAPCLDYRPVPKMGTAQKHEVPTPHILSLRPPVPTARYPRLALMRRVSLSGGGPLLTRDPGWPTFSGVVLKRWARSSRGIQVSHASEEKTALYPTAYKALKIILDIRYQYAIIVSLSRHDSSVPREQCAPFASRCPYRDPPAKRSF